jgi:hypothetical protein
MQLYSEKQIRDLHSEFKSHKKYAAKLAFFDRYFGIIPFSFPEFDPRLDLFFQDEKNSTLISIYKMERNNPGLTEKIFSFQEDFVFNIKPTNSNSAAYSSFILSRFLSLAPSFDEWIRLRESEGTSVEQLLGEANGIINKIEYRLQYEYDKSFHLQCMSVFYKGFYDAFCKQANMPGKKRKFIELYLYAQGIIYTHYIRSLKSALARSRYPEEFSGSSSLDFSGKLALLEDLGILDYLKRKFSRMDPFSFENKVAEIIQLITGETVERKDWQLSLSGNSLD